MLVIAGDIFSEKAEVTSRVNQVADTFRHLRSTFAAFFHRGGIIMGITGNHDQDGRVRPAIDTARSGMDLAEQPRRNGDHFEPGKMYLLDTAFVGRIADREGLVVQFVMMPFPNLGRVLTGTETASTPGELYRPTEATVAEWIRTLSDRPGYDPKLRTVFVGHFNVTDADIGRVLFRGHQENNFVLDAAALPISFDYVALGHIHKPQSLRGLKHVRYSGSLDRMNMGEAGESREVVLVDLGPEGLRSEPRPIPLTPTTLIEVTITHAETAAAELAEQVPHPATTLVKITVAPSAAAAGSAIEAILRNTEAQVADVDWSPPALLAESTTRTVPAGGTIKSRVLDYLAGRLPEEDPQRADILTLAATLLEAEGHS
ncbi:hypothetical protein BH11PLA2_BH11PLA2_48110 [soil metagenome]